MYIRKRARGTIIHIFLSENLINIHVFITANRMP